MLFTVLVFCSPTAEGVGVSAQIGAGVRGGSEARFRTGFASADALTTKQIWTGRVSGSVVPGPAVGDTGVEISYWTHWAPNWRSPETAFRSGSPLLFSLGTLRSSKALPRPPKRRHTLPETFFASSASCSVRVLRFLPGFQRIFLLQRPTQME